MAWRIKYTHRAIRDIEAAFVWIGQDSPRRAVAWQQGLLKTIERLALFPESAAVAPEISAFHAPVRHLIYSKGRSAYKVYYTISGKTVVLLHMRHSAQKGLQDDSG